MTLSEFFEPTNEVHLRALFELLETGNWPETFWQEVEALKIEIDKAWRMLILMKVTIAYLEEKGLCTNDDNN